MAWGRLDDKMAFNKKIVKAGNAAVGAWARMIAWSCGEGTDGIIPVEMVRTIATEAEMNKLITNNLLHQIDEENYEVHDYLDWNPSAQQVATKKSTASFIRSEAGKKGAASRWAKVEPQWQSDGKPPEVDAKHDDKADGKGHGKLDDKADGKADGKKMAPIPIPIPFPDPDPDPDPKNLNKTNNAGARAKGQEHVETPAAAPAPDPADQSYVEGGPSLKRIGQFRSAWNSSGLPPNGNSYELGALAAEIDAARAGAAEAGVDYPDDLAICRALKRITDAWARSGMHSKLQPSKLASSLGNAVRVASGEWDPDQEPQSTRPNGRGPTPIASVEFDGKRDGKTQNGHGKPDGKVHGKTDGKAGRSNGSHGGRP